MPSLQLTEGVTLIVNKDDEARATEVIREFRKSERESDQQSATSN
jgi:hypothetical protein